MLRHSVHALLIFGVIAFVAITYETKYSKTWINPHGCVLTFDETLGTNGRWRHANPDAECIGCLNSKAYWDRIHSLADSR